MARPKFRTIDMLKRAALAMAIAATSSCVSFPPAPPHLAEPHFEEGRLIASDGASLGLNAWRAENPKAVIVAVHGMNDYGHAFEGAGAWWSSQSSITVYAYDQRGFGRSPMFGRWAGEDTLIADLRSAISAARRENPHTPLFVLGHSMGAAVAIMAADDAPLDVDGVILAAPGVWGGGSMPILYRITLNLAATFAPGKTLTGERTGRRSTDNIPILREMFADPYVIKPTRLDAVVGVVRMMGHAYGASNEVGGKLLFLYGEKDEIIPVKTMVRASHRLCGDVDVKAYPEGWHLLFRDLQAEKVWRDVADWVLAASDEERASGAASPRSLFGPATSACLGGP